MRTTPRTSDTSSDSRRPRSSPRPTASPRRRAGRRASTSRLHDPEGARFRIPAAKTEAGVREVQMSPELVEEFVSHFDRLRRAGRRTDPDAYAFPDIRGGRIARQRVARMVGEAAARASERVSQRGLPPLPHTTPHTLRRTYVSIALLPARRLWVMGQVGHADSKMTIDVYAQLQQRVKREHGRAFDTLVRQAREQLYDSTSGLPEAAPEPNLGHESGTTPPWASQTARGASGSASRNRATCRRLAEWRDPGSNRSGRRPRSWGMDAVTADAWRDPDSNRSGRRPRSWGMDAVTADAWRDPDSNRSGRRPRSWGMDAVTADAWRDPDSNRSGRRPRSWGMDAVTADAWRDPDSNRSGRRPRSWGMDAVTADAWRDPDSNRGHHDFRQDRLTAARGKVPQRDRFRPRPLNPGMAQIPVHLPSISATRTAPWPKLRRTRPRTTC